MTGEEEAQKQACIDACERMSGGAESSGDVTAQYSQCEHEGRTGHVYEVEAEPIFGPVSDGRTGPVSEGRTGPVFGPVSEERTGPISEGRTGPVSEVNFNTSAAVVVEDAVVLPASEAVSAVTRMSGSSRQFRSVITFAVDKDWLSGWRSWITIFDTAAMINMIAAMAVDSSWKYVDGISAWSSVTSVDGVKIAVGGKVIIPLWC